MQARDTLGLVAAIDWTPVIVAVIGTIGSVLSALISAYVVWHIRTPSGTKIGKQVENANHLGIVNRHLLVRLSREMGLRADDPELRTALEEAQSD